MTTVVRDIHLPVEGVEVRVPQFRSPEGDQRRPKCLSNKRCRLVEVIRSFLGFSRLIGTKLERAAHLLNHPVAIKTHGFRVRSNDAVEVDSVREALEGVVLERLDLGKLNLGFLRYLFA